VWRWQESIRQDNKRLKSELAAMAKELQAVRDLLQDKV
jgi:hypothetical protein